MKTADQAEPKDEIQERHEAVLQEAGWLTKAQWLAGTGLALVLVDKLLLSHVGLPAWVSQVVIGAGIPALVFGVIGWIGLSRNVAAGRERVARMEYAALHREKQLLEERLHNQQTETETDSL